MADKIETRLASIRKSRGIGAAELAQRVGVTRQTIYAIEAGTYVPNTEVTLRLARELEVAVEELFSLPKDDADVTTTITAEYLGRGEPANGQAVRVSRLGGKWIGVPVDARPYHLPEADALVTGSELRSGRARLRTFSEDAAIQNKIVLA